jgi:hypothetical protein
MAAAEQRYLDESTTARHLNVSARTLQRWRTEGGGPAFIRAGLRRVLYDATEIERWVSSRTFAHRAAELFQRTA